MKGFFVKKLIKKWKKQSENNLNVIAENFITKHIKNDIRHKKYVVRKSPMFYAKGNNKQEIIGYVIEYGHVVNGIRVEDDFIKLTIVNDKVVACSGHWSTVKQGFSKISKKDQAIAIDAGGILSAIGDVKKHLSKSCKVSAKEIINIGKVFLKVGDQYKACYKIIFDNREHVFIDSEGNYIKGNTKISNRKKNEVNYE